MVILFDQFNLPEDIFKIVFATEQQQVVAKLLIDYIKQNKGEVNKTEMSLFATKLHDGKIVLKEGKPPFKKTETISYNKRQFYDRILTPMRTMGMIDYDFYRKVYKLSDQFQKLVYKIGLLWNKEINRELK